LTERQIVCPKHYKPSKAKKGNHINISWCFDCSTGGTLICCELCPASYHPECLGIEPPEDAFYCDSCQVGKLPVTGEVVWAKLGTYRWWPSQILHPSNIPENIQQLSHDDGEFPIVFFGTQEYAWMNHGRCFPYQEGDSDKVPGSSSANTSNLDLAFQKGLAEASKAYFEFTEAKNAREGVQEKTVVATPPEINNKPPSFLKIRSNQLFGDCPVYNNGHNDQQSCDCNPNKEDPCGKDSDCINRVLMMECSPKICPAAEKCGNMQFQRQKYPKLSVERASSKGWGLFPKQDLKKGDFIIEYVGELISTDEFKKRIDQNNKINKGAEKNCYYMVMDNRRVIDAADKGNIARFMNHSCKPNCETQKWTVNGDIRIGLFALKDIPAGTELNFNYQLEAFGDGKTPCMCGADNCSGFIGVKPIKEKRIKIKKQDNPPIVKAEKACDEYCFRCYKDGKFLKCNVKSCPKVYHLSCVNQDRMPLQREKWSCPWHHCVNCGKAANSSCTHCPNAYCKNHDSAIKTHPQLGQICDEHKDELGDLLKFFVKINEPIQDDFNESTNTPMITTGKHENKIALYRSLRYI